MNDTPYTQQHVTVLLWAKELTAEDIHHSQQVFKGQASMHSGPLLLPNYLASMQCMLEDSARQWLEQSITCCAGEACNNRRPLRARASRLPSLLRSGGAAAAGAFAAVPFVVALYVETWMQRHMIIIHCYAVQRHVTAL